MSDHPNPSVIVQTVPVCSTVEYPVLKKLGKQNIRKFLADRAAYEREIQERSRQEGSAQCQPVSLKFSVDPALLASLVDLRQLGDDVLSVAQVTDHVVDTWLQSHREIRRDALSISQVNLIVTRSLRINMAEKDAAQRIVMLFADYTSLMRVHGLSWVIAEHPKVAVGHLVAALRPVPLQRRIREDLEFSYEPLAKDFLNFIKHTMEADHFLRCAGPSDR
jgi:hypothetical protein